jgi:hypothetical protein
VSEQNILNPTQTSLLNPNYGYEEQKLPTLAELLAGSGKWFGRHAVSRGRVYSLGWQRRDKATMHALRQWAEQYRQDFFTFKDWERNRTFSGRFDGELVISPAGNERWNISGRFVELPGLAMQTYPADWTRDAAFLEERNGFGEDLLKLLPAADWTYVSHANHHGGAAYSNPNTDTTDTAEWQYFGYGFQLWARKNSNLGKMDVSVTRVRDGVVILAATEIDLYAASDTAAAAVLTQTNYALDVYRVKLQTKNTRNGTSSANTIYADALQVMR